jgi:hypothetical protein
MALSSTVMFKLLCTPKQSFLTQCKRKFLYKEHGAVRFVAITPKTEAGGGPPLIGYKQQLIQYIRSYLPSTNQEGIMPW